jgi:hypothetical protein
LVCLPAQGESSSNSVQDVDSMTVLHAMLYMCSGFKAKIKPLGSIILTNIQ